MGSRKRISRNATGEVKVLSLRRLHCTGCCKIHHELPDFLVPYKRYESTCIEEVVSLVPFLSNSSRSLS
ncbi:DUF6431 domain-containing protein [Paenibacillus naphthalenovorans]|uniref:DUF6431 domain-containing protein n=1 Tax=Paenibacillus naphthalenovorans TaxID=162209 RepID=UPI002674A6AB|nr:DUF6431 domain-containing protein [Paenibacillus naphthalenovorans]